MRVRARRIDKNRASIPSKNIPEKKKGRPERRIERVASKKTNMLEKMKNDIK